MWGGLSSLPLLRKQGIHDTIEEGTEGVSAMTNQKPQDTSSQRTQKPITPRQELREFTPRDLDSVVRRDRRLPHWELGGSAYFVTFGVVKALEEVFLPSIKAALRRTTPSPEQTRRASPVLRETCFGPTDRCLEMPPSSQGVGPCPCLAEMVDRAIRFFSGSRYVLDAYVIMPDHVHLLVRPLYDWTLSKILQGLKGFTAREINRALGRAGHFWQIESFDHLIRNEEDWLDKQDYIHNNPVKAGLVENGYDYPFSSLASRNGARPWQDPQKD